MIGAAADDNWVKLSFKVREESQVHISEVGKKSGSHEFCTPVIKNHFEASVKNVDSYEK